MKFRGMALMVTLALCFALATLSWAAEQGFMWDGTQWKALSSALKVAYVKGVGNMADFEAGAGAGGQAGCISKALVAELKTKSIGQVVQEVDKYYKDNPGKMNSPVLEVILLASTKLCAPEPPAAAPKK